jgi:ribosomal protein S18 acetylase RimI-like enzyme
VTDDTAALKVMTLEEGALNGWPALHTEAHGGWLWRFADGYTKRANAVLPLYAPAPHDAGRRIDAAEAAYGRAGLPATFKVPGLPAWSALDAVLAARGYALVDPSLVMTRALVPDRSGATAPVTVSGSPTDADVSIVERFTPGWFDGFFEANRIAVHHQPTSAALASRVARPLVGSLTRGTKAVAWAYVALVGDQAWLFDVVVHPDHRRQGLGRQLVQTLVRRAAAAGARRCCLQSFAANAVARALYEGLGFTEAYPYWYRVAPSPGPKVP